jgi:wyosine [tRNA(Phe)-imidazoG37] synthetase (radical SAM superfamily)|tara:strand:+ start:213 stop:1358 length:1146 start_codon:yes stop_codon:yes gene_type:complete
MEKKKVDKFIKFNSFEHFKVFNSLEKKEIIEKLKKLKLSFNTNSEEKKKIVLKAIDELSSENSDQNNFELKNNTLAELKSLNETDYLEYIYHRYRYEMFPILKKIDNYPPCLQIEPSSICNFRCIFCFETDKTFTNKKSGHMGTMKLEDFKEIIDDAEGNIQFITLASRGEPLVSKSISKMISYTSGKFLNLKLNTNASLLNEEICNTILSDTVKTLVISADAADKDEYSKIRVNGNLDKIVKNLELFNSIKEKHYKNSKIITRVSGVNFSKDQNFEKMTNFWKNFVDQIVFVKYNPWENSYLAPESKIEEPCSDLWRRMFIWWDKKVNPCDVDYKSKLSVGKYENSISESWNSKNYNKLRDEHLSKQRKKIIPCNSCTVV